MNIADIIDSAYPSDSSTGIPLNSQIKIIFDREIDEWSIENGGILLEGPDSDELIISPYTPSVINAGAENQMLQTPGLRGLVPGKFTFERVDLNTNTLVSTLDTVGDGSLYRTKAIFTPDYPLKKSTEYSLYIIGAADEDQAGIFTNTVFDPVSSVSNTGTGSITVSGVYLGNASTDEIFIKITKAGVVGVAEFEVWKNSSPLNLIGPILTSINQSHIIDGVTVAFNEGSFAIDDEFSVKVKLAEKFTGTVITSFTTGAGSISSLPASASTSILGDPLFTPSIGFNVVSTSPEDGTSNLSLMKNRLIIEFSSEVDSLSINDEAVEITSEAISDHPCAPQPKIGSLHKTLTASGNFLIIDL